jgi:ubiquitin-conjugating enzyme E2 variant
MAPQSPLLSLSKAMGVAVAVALYVVLLWRTVLASLQLDAAWLAFVGLLVGYLLADFASGLVHWFCDTFFSEDTPLIGRLLIGPFREHHELPQRIAECRFIEQDTGNFFVLIPLLAVLLMRPALSMGGLLGAGIVLGLCAGSFVVNSVHRWAHAEQAPRWVRVLQRAGLIISPERHARHHTTHDRSYCITLGWLNPPLDSLAFFPRLERAIRRLQR